MVRYIVCSLQIGDLSMCIGCQLEWIVSQSELTHEVINYKRVFWCVSPSSNLNKNVKVLYCFSEIGRSLMIGTPWPQLNLARNDTHAISCEGSETVCKDPVATVLALFEQHHSRELFRALILPSWIIFRSDSSFSFGVAVIISVTGLHLTQHHHCRRAFSARWRSIDIRW